jgi:hypothetical protein
MMTRKSTKNILPKLAVAGFLLLLSGCGRLGYESRYTADLAPQVQESVAKAYYSTLDKSITQRGTVAKDSMAAVAEVGRAIGQPLAPAEAVRTRQEMAVTGNSKTFDIAKNVPPEQLFPLAQERTKQVQALSVALRQSAEVARVDVAAPAGFVNPSTPQPAPFDFSTFDLFPAGQPEQVGGSATGAKCQVAPVGEQVKDDYVDVRAAALERLKQEDQKHGNTTK